MRRVILAMVLLALAPAVGVAQIPSIRWEEIPVPPHVEQGSLWFTAASKGFWENSPALPQALEEPSWPAPVAPDPWGTLRQLQSGQKIRVVDANLHRVNAQFLGVSDDFLKFRANGKTVIVEREKVMMVSLRPPSRAKQILLGILAGALVGMSAWVEADKDARHCWDDEGYYCEKETGLSGRSAVIFPAVGAGALGIMAAFVKQADQVIYVRPPGNGDAEPPADSSLQPTPTRLPSAGSVVAPAPSDEKALRAQRHKIRQELRRERAAKRVISVELDRQVQVGGTDLRPGLYQLVLLERQADTGELYFFAGKRVKTKKVASTAQGEIAPQAGDSVGSLVTYKEGGGTAEIQTPARTLRIL